MAAKPALVGSQPIDLLLLLSLLSLLLSTVSQKMRQLWQAVVTTSNKHEFILIILGKEH